ncbi:alpha/beta fold hydrolase [Thomasclavelia cocleata]|uniref:Monoacylglycerol lipase n=2 Tax=Thomasclavelia cocleata TaxID=69824 RepID=A0A829ZDT2_9FIRM|nr:alpha/beta fold hydrolase [Thomasclavelia cocleata]GFI42319.1 monoacylglycerol lipase [Thomasclavelia cocleata]
MERLKINSSCDNLPLDVIISTCADPKGIVQIAHGMCEYKERYLDFINNLNQNGYIVIIHDHRGHGKSVLNENDLGYFYNDGASAIVEDIYLLSKYIKNRFNDLPLYLLGHSMGSLIVRNYIQKYDYEIDGLIICGSPSYNKLTKVGKVVCKLFMVVKDERYCSKLMQKMFFGAFNKRFDKQNEWICSDRNIVDAYNQDPLCTFIFTINGFYNLLTLMQRTYQSIDYSINSELSILFISGRDDPCLINEKAFKQAVNHIKNNGYKDVNVILFDKMRHEILNEQNKQEVYNSIINFLGARDGR